MNITRLLTLPAIVIGWFIGKAILYFIVGPCTAVAALLTALRYQFECFYRVPVFMRWKKQQQKLS
jgi:hypothetical protein